MDPTVAKRMESELVGKLVGPWLIDRLLGSGKSAVVFRATHSGREAALKVFDPDLVERVSEPTQLERIEREKRLIGQRHENLVQIYDGGKCELTKYLFIAMERIDAPDLEKVLQEVPRDRIRPLIAQLAAAAKFLDDMGLAHRDIKPSNIACSRDFQRLTLLDLGVLKPIGDGSLTDVVGHPFVGTKQYSPPEFLFRTEADNPDGWRAVSFYQIGAVLHDLLTGRRIFEEHISPEARLIEAVKFIVPKFDVPGADPELVALAGSCLAKEPATRLRLVKWENFSATAPKVTAASLKDRVMKRQAAAVVPVAEPVPAVNVRRALNELVSRATGIVRDESADNSDVLPPVEVHDHPAPDGSTAVFRAAFPKMAEKGIPNAFALAFRITVLDVSANLVEIVVSAAVSGNVEKFSPEGYGPTQPVYSGPFGEELVKSRIRLALYAGIEAAMGHSPIGDDAVEPLPIQIPETQE